MEKRKPSFILILVTITTDKLAALFFAVVSAGMGFEEWRKGVSMMYTWFWWVLTIFFLVYIVSSAVREYQKELEVYRNSSSDEQDNAPKNFGVSSLNQSGGFTGSNTGKVFQGDVYYQERDNAPAEFYVPNPKELKSKIKIETLNLQRELKTLLYLSGENRRKQLKVVLEITVNIWKNLLNPAKTIFPDTQIPVLIDEIYTQITSFKMNWETLKYEYDEKNTWLRVAKSNHPEIIVINKKIANLETELDQLENTIEARINLLIDLTKN